MLRQLGCDIVGMTGAPEVFLAREAGLCYASLSFVSNKAAGMQSRVSHKEVLEIAAKYKTTINSIIVDTLKRIGLSKSCSCGPLRDMEV
jgi:5'-methylthioadenosine phosphorylase